MINNNKNTKAFTIVELLVVIVVIGILAAITIVSYSGISQRATVASLQTDLANSSKKLKMYYVLYGSYPTALGADKCPTAPNVDTNYCLKTSSTHTISNYSATANTFTLTETSANDTSYTISDNSSPQAVVSLAVSDPANWITVGTQVWARYNLNVGTRIASTVAQTNNGGTNIVEKYCYGNTDAGCTNTDSNGIPYGGLYRWSEAMGYSITEKAQGICPAGSHIPSDNDWKILEAQLGMELGVGVGMIDYVGWRGDNQGTQLKSGGVSGLNIPLAGSSFSGGAFVSLSVTADLWSSSGSITKAWTRYMDNTRVYVGRGESSDTSYGWSVRCVGD